MPRLCNCRIFYNAASHYYSTLLQIYPFIRNCPEIFLLIIKSLLLRFTSPGLKGRSILSKLSALKSLDPLVNYQSFMESSDFSQLISSFETSNSVINSYFVNSSITEFLDSLMLNDFNTYLPNDILYKTDTTSMSHSLEVRAPFLDNQVIEYASLISSSNKLTSSQSKIPLRTLAMDLLPASITNRPKQGFLPPLNYWLRVPSFKAHFKEVIYSCPFFNQRFLDNLFAYSNLGFDNSSVLFQLYMFSCVYNKHNFYI